MSKVLVTGGLGYIGSHTVVELLEKKIEPLILDDLSNSKLEVLDRIEQITSKRPEFIELSLMDSQKLSNLFNENKIDSIIHFAAFKAVGESVKKPLDYYKNNVISLINLIELASIHQVNQFVFSSSCTVYGQPTKLPVTEESPILPSESPYGNTKQICEEIIEDFCKANPLFKAVSLRYFNPVGAHNSALIGELPLGIPNNLVPFIMQTATGVREQLNVFGSDYDTPDGTCIRDYIHVVDLAVAHISALEYISKMDRNHDFFNIGTGNGHSVLEVIKTFEAISGKKLNYQLIERRAGDIEKIYADISKASEKLGWNAQRGLKEMMKTAWNWQKYISKM